MAFLPVTVAAEFVHFGAPRQACCQRILVLLPLNEGQLWNLSGLAVKPEPSPPALPFHIILRSPGLDDH